jgi:prepilin-type processing-associated H-X9-DG protein
MSGYRNQAPSANARGTGHKQPPNTSVVKGVASKIYILHNASPYIYLNPAEYYTWATDSYASGGIANLNLQRQLFAHADGTNLGYADGHVKWASRRNMVKFCCVNQGSWNSFDMNNTCGYWNFMVEPPA